MASIDLAMQRASADLLAHVDELRRVSPQRPWCFDLRVFLLQVDCVQDDWMKASTRLDGLPFARLADAGADSRLGPVIEPIVNDTYDGVPVSRLLRIEVEKTANLRDFVWTPATSTRQNGAANLALIPTRYPGSGRETDDALRLLQATDREQPGGAWHGVGQRMLTTDQADFALLDVRVIAFDTPLIGFPPLQTDMRFDTAPTARSTELSNG